MTLVRHLVATDVARAWPLLVLSAMWHAARLGLHELTPQMWARWPLQAPFLDAVWLPGLIADGVLCGLVIAVVVHGDPLVDPRAFWRTRPVGPGDLFLARLVTCGAVVVVVPTALNIARMLAYAAPADAIASASLQLAMTRLAWLCAAWAIASITATTRAFILAAVGAGVCWAVAFAAIAAITFGRTSPADVLVYIPALPLPDLTGSYEAFGLMVALGLAMVAWQHRARRTIASFVAIVVVGALAIWVRMNPIGAFARASEPAPPALAAGDPRVVLAGGRLEHESIQRVAERDPIVSLSGRFTLLGVPRGYSTMIIPLRTRTAKRGGATIEARGAPSLDDPFLRVDPEMAYKRLADDSMQSPALPADADVVPTKLTVTQASRIRPLYGALVDLDTTLELRFTRYRVLGRVKLANQASLRLDTGDLFEVARVVTHGTSVIAVTRHTRFPTLVPRVGDPITTFLRDVATDNWTRAASLIRTPPLTPTGFGFASQGFFSSADAAWASEWQVQWELDVTPPDGEDRASWLERHELVVASSAYAGRTSRPWRGTGLYVPDLERPR